MGYNSPGLAGGGGSAADPFMSELNPTVVAYKATSELVIGDNTLANDSDLVVDVLANTTYLIRLRLYTEQNTTPDFKMKLVLPASATVVWGRTTIGEGPAVGAETNVAFSTFNRVFEYRGIVVISSTAGTAQLQWSQNQSDSGRATILRAGSSLALWSAGDNVKFTAADQTITSDTELSTDTALTIALLANTSYVIAGVLMYDAHATPDFQTGLIGPTSCKGQWSERDDDGGVAFTDSVGSAIESGTAGTTRLSFVIGSIRNNANAGDLLTQWAANTSSAEDCILKKGSCMAAWPIGSR